MAPTSPASVQTRISGEGYEEPKADDKKDKSLAGIEPGYLIGGIAAAVAVMLGGLWLVRRRR